MSAFTRAFYCGSSRANTDRSQERSKSGQSRRHAAQGGQSSSVTSPPFERGGQLPIRLAVRARTRTSCTTNVTKAASKRRCLIGISARKHGRKPGSTTRVGNVYGRGLTRLTKDAYQISTLHYKPVETTKAAPTRSYERWRCWRCWRSPRFVGVSPKRPCTHRQLPS